MVFNRAAKKILEQQAATTSVVLHDWRVYQLASAVDSTVHYDPQPMLNLVPIRMTSSDQI
jgi:hypothetical protein